MAKAKTSRETVTGRWVIKPIGKGKAERFTAVEGLKKSAASRVLSSQLSGRGLKGDDYRQAVIKVFKKASP